MKKKEVATIILNRNLKSVTDKLYKKILKYNKKHTHVYIVDSGSDKKKKICIYYLVCRLEIC